MKTKTELLNSYLNQYPELTELFLSIIQVKTGHYTFDSLCEIAGFNKDQRNKIDSAYPVDYARSIEQIYPDFNNGLNCFNYNDNKTFGDMFNMNNAIVKNIFKKL
jgi:hypothetical protein